ncbi:hypothetical protein PDJAM_G00009980, partial [Pangasius djambal]|nr:hypothetical protein [Pangasius djambal]
SQVLSIGSQTLLNRSGSLSNLGLKILSQRGHGLLEFLQVLIYFLSEIFSVGLQLGLQLLHFLLQTSRELLGLLQQGSFQSFRVKGLSVGSHSYSQLLHSLLNLGLQILSIGLQFVSHSGQVLLKTLLQNFSLLGDF